MKPFLTEPWPSQNQFSLKSKAIWLSKLYFILFPGTAGKIWPQRQIWRTRMRAGASPRCSTSSPSPSLISLCRPPLKWAAWWMAWTSYWVTACRRTLLWVSVTSFSRRRLHYHDLTFSDKKSQVQWWSVREDHIDRDITNINDDCQPNKNLNLYLMKKLYNCAVVLSIYLQIKVEIKYCFTLSNKGLARDRSIDKENNC